MERARDTWTPSGAEVEERFLQASALWAHTMLQTYDFHFTFGGCQLAEITLRHNCFGNSAMLQATNGSYSKHKPKRDTDTVVQSVLRYMPSVDHRSEGVCCPYSDRLPTSLTLMRTDAGAQRKDARRSPGRSSARLLLAVRGGATAVPRIYAAAGLKRVRRLTLPASLRTEKRSRVWNRKAAPLRRHSPNPVRVRVSRSRDLQSISDGYRWEDAVPWVSASGLAPASTTTSLLLGQRAAR
ncbi:hypothetical protein K488DRAFT_72238 [Vararia minispora EC-137]|uniref:Uncharacterized protein n=1 Tax=Vararia minispora EC-137 TaxID=1314806 RepID=A0ACB8QFL6_9AGAM|nr:hypothetical protein K488DRAFT_72238 [Vararia minispora EC-137]